MNLTSREVLKEWYKISDEDFQYLSELIKRIKNEN